MMVHLMAYWHGMTWGVTENEIAFLESLSTGFSYQTSTNADKNGASPTENVGMEDISVTFETTYRVETGTRDIKGKLDQWQALVGKAGPLIIGGNVFGPERLQLKDVKAGDISVNAQGRLRAMKISFTFVEYKDEVSSGTSSTTSSGSETAVGVGASVSTKESKKTVSIDGAMA